MSSMRHETYHAGDYLIKGLWQTGHIAKMRHDGGDIFLFEKTSGELVSIHMIESGIPLYEIRKTLSENAAQGIYTMFMLWAAMMVPLEGKLYKMDDWMSAFLALNGGSVYAYDIINAEIYIFPVYFRGTDRVKLTEYGLTIDVKRLACRTIETDLPGFKDTWYVADFRGVEATPHQETHERSVPPVFQVVELEACYSILGVQPGDNRETIKQAYRTRARQYHPDFNTAPDATEQMQNLNAAYERVLDLMEE